MTWYTMIPQHWVNICKNKDLAKELVPRKTSTLYTIKILVNLLNEDSILFWILHTCGGDDVNGTVIYCIRAIISSHYYYPWLVDRESACICDPHRPFIDKKLVYGNFFWDLENLVWHFQNPKMSNFCRNFELTFQRH